MSRLATAIGKVPYMGIVVWPLHGEFVTFVDGNPIALADADAYPYGEPPQHIAFAQRGQNVESAIVLIKGGRNFRYYFGARALAEGETAALVCLNARSIVTYEAEDGDVCALKIDDNALTVVARKGGFPFLKGEKEG